MQVSKEIGLSQSIKSEKKTHGRSIAPQFQDIPLHPPWPLQNEAMLSSSGYKPGTYQHKAL
jgi:hypothetical protein